MKQTRQPVCAVKQSIYLDVYGANSKKVNNKKIMKKNVKDDRIGVTFL
jgi:hypothetical protein